MARLVLVFVLLVAMHGGALAAATATDFPAVRPGRGLVFPRDLGAHPDYRTEWWYVTGWLRDEGGVERGFQLTFFRVRTGIGEDNPSRFAPRQLLLAHVALADPHHGRLRHAQRAQRVVEPLAGAAEGDTHVWIGDWALRRDGERYRATAAGEGFAFELSFAPAGPPLPNGDGGFSRKARDPKHASYYYSRPQLAVAGRLEIDGALRDVEGKAWLDHEWSSQVLPPEARGWDWIGINLDGGGSLMAFRMRGASGDPVWGGGTLCLAGESPRTLGPDEVTFTPLRHWRSPRTGARYPVEWRISVGERMFRVVPLMDDQELDARASAGAVYWEGAVRLFEDGDEIGRGYLEMTGYLDRLRM